MTMHAVRQLLLNDYQPAFRQWARVLLYVALMTHAPLGYCDEGEAAPRSRQRFIRALHEVIPGHSADQVRKLLGSPDLVIAVRTPEDNPNVANVWLYGAKQPMDIATLGRVYMSSSNTVHATVGIGPQTSLDAFDDPTLDKLIRAMNADRLMMTPKYDPRTMMRILNRLRSFTAMEQKAAIIEFIRVLSDDELHASRVVMEGLAQLAFEPKSHSVYTGPAGDIYRIAQLQQQQEFPQLPFVVVEGVPLYAQFVFNAGDRERYGSDRSKYLDTIRRRERWASVHLAKIVPPRTPELLLDAFLKSTLLVGPDAPFNEPDFILARTARDRTVSRIVRQLLQLVSTDFQPSAEVLEDIKSPDHSRQVRGIEKIRSSLSERQWRWDETNCEYRLR